MKCTATLDTAHDRPDASRGLHREVMTPRGTELPGVTESPSGRRECDRPNPSHRPRVHWCLRVPSLPPRSPLPPPACVVRRDSPHLPHRSRAEDYSAAPHRLRRSGSAPAEDQLGHAEQKHRMSAADFHGHALRILRSVTANMIERHRAN